MPSADQSKFIYWNLYILIIMSLPIRITYIRSIIITVLKKVHQHPLYIIIRSFHSSPTSLSHITPISRPYSSSSVDLSSVQLLSPIISHQQIRVNLFIGIYIYWLLCHYPSGYPISDQLSSPSFKKFINTPSISL